MTEKQIIEMWKNSGDLEVIGMPYSKIEAFAKAVAQHEREACAKLAMTISEKGLPEEMPEGDELLKAINQIVGGVLIADAIRARGEA